MAILLYNNHSIKSLVKRYFLKVTIFFILDEDINLNSTVFLWLDEIKKIFESSKNMLTDRRIEVERILFERYGVK